MLREAEGDALTLTNLRIRQHSKAADGEKIVSIILAQVASCGVLSVSAPILLVVAALCGVGVVFVEEVSAKGGLAVVALVLVGLFFATKRLTLAIASAGHTIKADIRGMSTDKILKFVDAIEKAALTRDLDSAASVASRANKGAADKPIDVTL